MCSTQHKKNHRNNRRHIVLLLGLLAYCTVDWRSGAVSRAHEPAVKSSQIWIEAPQVAGEMAQAAKALLATFDFRQRVRGTYLFQDAERKNFHFFPIPRRGVPLKDLSIAQRQLAYGLVNTGLSNRGFWKAVTIMSLGELLRESTPDEHNEFRDSDQYYLSIFGTPGEKGAWGWRMEGFHLSINFTILDGRWIAYTPSFFGSIPASVQEGPREGLQVLRHEEQWARELAQSLDTEQRKKCFRPLPVFEETVGGLVSGNAARLERAEPLGLAAADMTAAQKEQLTRLIHEYALRHRRDLAEQDLKRIEQRKIENIYFSWAGSLQPGEPHYYTVQGPTFLIEYDNTQDDANHVHTVWRDFDNDFGADLIRQHYQRHHHVHD